MDRRVIPLCIAIFTFFAFYAAPVAAVSITATVSPSETNASDTDILVNFTITHSNTTANITQLNITLPSGFTYSGSISEDATTSANSTALDRDTTSGIIKWTNTSSARSFVTATNRFWFEIDTPGSNATFNFNVSARDTGNIIASVNVTFKLLDTIAPKFSSNTTSVASGAKFVYNQTYVFSATWTDRIAVNTTIIEHNFTGTAANYTMSQSGSSYSYNFTNLGANLYVWRMYANDSVNNVNKTDQYLYNVSKADNILEIYLDSKRNQDYQTSNESSLNATANATAGTVSIYRNSNLVVSGATPQSSIASLASGTYTFKANATGNQNYSDNSTGLSFTATLSGPAPKWSSNTTTLPSAYTNSTASVWQVTWSDNTDASAFSTATIELNYTGSTTNYTMYRVPGTNKSEYNATMPAGAIKWKVYANNTNNVFNTTPSWLATVTKATPTINVSSNIGFTVDIGGTTNVTCGADTNQATTKLYRNGASVTSPDTATLTVGIYTYICNSTETQNYSTGSKTQNLEIRSFPKYLSIVNFSSALKLIEVTEGITKSVVIEMKNTGNLTDTVTFVITGINSSWYTIDETVAKVAPRGGVASFAVNFTVESVEIKDYDGKFELTGADGTLVSDFTLRILPGQATKLKINDTYTLYKTEFLKMADEINNTKKKNLNVSTAETKYDELAAKLSEAESAINQDDYFKATQILDEIKPLLDSTRQELTNAQTITEEEKNQQQQESNSTIIIIIVVVIVIAGGAAAYLLWPPSEKPGTPKPTEEAKQATTSIKTAPTTVTERGGLKDVTKSFVDKFKEIAERNKKFRYKYKGGE